MRKTWLIFSQAVTVALAALFVVTTLKPQWLERSGSVAVAPDPLGSPGAAPRGEAVVAQGMEALSQARDGEVVTSFSVAVKRAAPAVVSIMTTARARPTPQSQDPWFQYFFGDQGGEPAPAPSSGMGSGVIVSEQGYVLTNNHVVERMDRIEVQLSDGRRSVAKVVGTDPETDLAVLQVSLDKLPVMGFGDSNALQVGDVVLAIGNPFGVGQTVTSGIVSALGRNQLGINTFENFIQTDAAINPGNSGGALVDTHGRLMGINTAIYSRSGGSLGIGFAIPASTAQQVLEGLIKDGQVTRGWIGVEPRDLTPEMFEAVGVEARSGVLISGVLQGGPAADGGVRPGDVVTAVDGKLIVNTAQLLHAVAALRPGEQATLGLQRGSQAMEVKVTVAKRPAISKRANSGPRGR